MEGAEERGGIERREGSARGRGQQGHEEHDMFAPLSLTAGSDLVPTVKPAVRWGDCMTTWRTGFANYRQTIASCKRWVPAFAKQSMALAAVQGH